MPQTMQERSKKNNAHNDTIVMILVFLIGILTASLVFCTLYFNFLNKKNDESSLETCAITESASYQGNQGDSFIDVIGENQNTRGNTSVDGTIYTHGLEAWIARWNDISESSWAYAVFDLEPGYQYLSGSVILIESYNTDNFDSTLYFYDGDRLIDSFELYPQSIPFERNSRRILVTSVMS